MRLMMSNDSSNGQEGVFVSPRLIQQAAMVVQ